MNQTQEEQWSKDTWDTEKKKQNLAPQPPPEELDTYAPKKQKSKDVTTLSEAEKSFKNMKEPEPVAPRKKITPMKRSWGSDCESDSE